MIRLIIFAIGLFLLWLLFLSGLNKRSKIIGSVVAVVLAVAGAWFEGFGNSPRLGVVKADQITSCGTTAEHSYRSNYNVSFCLENSSSTGTTQRIGLRFVALDCSVDPCLELDQASKQLAIEIPPGQQLELVENLEFDRLAPGREELSWRVYVVSVKATD